MLLRLDGSDVPGLYSTDGYLDIESMPDDEVAGEILNRLSMGTSRTIKTSGLGFILRRKDGTSATQATSVRRSVGDPTPRPSMMTRVLAKLRSPK
jgi:hypothetical protein